MSTMKKPVTEWASKLVVDLLCLGARPERIGLPRSVVTALGREAQGVSAGGPGGLPLGVVVSADGIQLEAHVSCLFHRKDGTVSVSLDEFPMNTPAGVVTFFSVEAK